MMGTSSLSNTRFFLFFHKQGKKQSRKSLRILKHNFIFGDNALQLSKNCLPKTFMSTRARPLCRSSFQYFYYNLLTVQMVHFSKSNSLVYNILAILWLFWPIWQDQDWLNVYDSVAKPTKFYIDSMIFPE